MKLAELININQQREGGGAFQLESSKMLGVKVDGRVWAKAESMVAYAESGKLAQRHGGMGTWLQNAMTGEGPLPIQLTGKGVLCLADHGKKVHVLELEAADAISVNGNDVLAFQSSVVSGGSAEIAARGGSLVVAAFVVDQRTYDGLTVSAGRGLRLSSGGSA